MATLGAQYCTSIEGTIPGPAMRVRTFVRWGINGTGAQVGGVGAGRFHVTAVLWSTKAGVLAWMAAIEALQGTQVTIVDDFGATYTNCFIQHVRRRPMKGILIPGESIDAIGTLTLSGIRR